MQDDVGIVQLCQAIYTPASEGWDKLWSGEVGGIYAGIKDNALIFRGSITKEDWFRDLLVLPHYPLNHPQLGLVHTGFYEGMDEFFEEASKFLGPNPVIGGHSLGAARAWLFAGRLISEGSHPGRIVVCGSPKPGCGQLRNLLAPYSKASFKNRYDPVTVLPIPLPDFPCIDMADFTMLNIIPTRDDILADHDISNYVSGVK